MNQQYRVGALAIVWAAVTAILIALAAAGALIDLGGMIITLAILAAAGTATSSIMGVPGETKPLVDVKVDSSKRKNDDLSEMAALLALLDEDDAYELRQRIKQRLIDALDTGTVDASSFDDLMRQSGGNPSRSSKR